MEQQKRSKAIQDLEPKVHTMRKLEALLRAVEHVPVRETHLDVLLSWCVTYTDVCVENDVYVGDGTA